jgi:hypothetical protein
LACLGLATLAAKVPLRALLHSQAISFRELFVGFFVLSRQTARDGKPVVRRNIRAELPMSEDIVECSWKCCWCWLGEIGVLSQTVDFRRGEN